jgi:hypothetical protein
MRDTLRDAIALPALITYRALNCTCTYTSKTGSVTLYCWAGPLNKSGGEVLDLEVSKDSRQFWIPKQDNFDEDTPQLDDVITFEDHNYHVESIANEDGIGAIFELTAVCTRPIKAGTK